MEKVPMVAERLVAVLGALEVQAIAPFILTVSLARPQHLHIGRPRLLHHQTINQSTLINSEYYDIQFQISEESE